ncbi:kinase-like domain-containing protein [Aspergillus karnatakaensis]|uniref:kinase-like domain-containing protein n=1 Tax=Aspergillus karnatakaensis TaxID=1810916 RepID=UPI003CCE29B2
MSRIWVPPILRPDYTWPAPPLTTVSKTTPPVPSMPGKLKRRIWGIIHKALYHFSQYYVSWFGTYNAWHVYQLPFGLVMKWTDRASIQEVAAMQMARAAGMPVPKVISCGDHPNEPCLSFSILMTRLPGFDLFNLDEPFDPDHEGPWLQELKTCVDAMRLWTPPTSTGICSVLGTEIRTHRVSNHIMGPFGDAKPFYEYLFAPTSSRTFECHEAFEKTVSVAERLRHRSHRVMFTHGDFKAHNIMIDDDMHLTGFLDWETAGWYPEFWEFTTAMRFRGGSWWYQVASWLGGEHYLDELASDRALNNLTVDSYIGF